MQLFCSACQAAFPGVQRCPRCGGLLLMPHEVSPDATLNRSTAAPKAQPNVWGRIGIGVVLALGAYLAIRKIVMGTVLALLDDDADAWWLSLHGLTAVYTAQAIAVVFGSVIASAGRARGYCHGLAVGGLCGGLFLALELLTGVPSQVLVIYLQPCVLALLGLVAGVVGARIWGVSPTLDIPVPNPSKLSSIQLQPTTASDTGKPTMWVRVAASAAIMVCGVTAAESAKIYAQKYSLGLLRVQNMAQGEFITWQLAAFTILLGGVVAGAGTGAGIRHGFYAGALGGAGVLAICLKQGALAPPIAFWLEQISLDHLDLLTPTILMAVPVSILTVGVVGGWLGGALFLPLAPLSMRKRLRIGGD